MIILTGEKESMVVFNIRQLCAQINDAIAKDGDLFNKISVYRIYDEIKDLVRVVLGNDEVEAMEKLLESARVSGLENRVSKLENRNRTLEDDLRQSRAELQNFKRSLVKEEVK